MPNKQYQPAPPTNRSPAENSIRSPRHPSAKLLVAHVFGKFDLPKHAQQAEGEPLADEQAEYVTEHLVDCILCRTKVELMRVLGGARAAQFD